MHYANPRFQQMRPSYERSQGSFGPRSASPQEVGQEGLIHPGLLASGGAPFETQETPDLPQGYPTGPASPGVHPTVQQGWPTHGFQPPFQGQAIPFPQPLPPFGLQGSPGQPSWAQPNVPPGISQGPQGQPMTPSTGIGQTGLPSQQGWGSPTMAGRPEVSQPRVRQPAFDLIDEGENLVFEIEIPGVSKDDVQLVCNEKGLSVRASTKKGQHEEDAYLHAERGQVKYERYIPLELAIVPDKVKAAFQNGILTVTCQKQQPSSGLQKVEIK